MEEMEEMEEEEVEVEVDVDGGREGGVGGGLVWFGGDEFGSLGTLERRDLRWVGLVWW